MLEDCCRTCWETAALRRKAVCSTCRCNNARRLEIVVEHVGRLLYYAWRLCVVHAGVIYVRKQEIVVIHVGRLL